MEKHVHTVGRHVAGSAQLAHDVAAPCALKCESRGQPGLPIPELRIWYVTEKEWEKFLWKLALLWVNN